MLSRLGKGIRVWRSLRRRWKSSSAAEISTTQDTQCCDGSLDACTCKVTKKKNSQSQKVDGVVASIMALGTYLDNHEDDDFFFEVVNL